jgi:GNAT superfamily N-acetyltransferase
MQIRACKPKDVEAASLLIMRTYAEYNHDEGVAEATESYIEAYDPTSNLDELKKRFGRTPICYVAIENQSVVGVVRGVPGRLINLFVDGQYHRRGIGKKLLLRFESECQKRDAHKIKTNASIFGILFYEANGYKKSTGVRNLKGLLVQPMRKRLT